MRNALATTAAAALMVFGLFGATAWAQDYTVSTVSNRWSTPPAGKTPLGLGSHQTTTITLPFPFIYFGDSYTSANVGDEGFMQISPVTTNSSRSTSPLPCAYDGTIAVAWYYHMHASGGSQVNTHLTGSAPNRVFHVTWEGVGSPGIYAQIQLYETSGRIVFAYTTGGNWGSANPYYQGIQGVGTDRRFVLADGSNSGKNTQPQSDYQFDPVVTNYTGRLLTDKLVSDATGIGNSVMSSLPVAGVQIELVNNTSNAVVGRGTTDANGYFTISGLSLNSAQTGKLRVSAQSTAAVLRPGSGADPTSLDLPGTINFSAGANVGTFVLNNSIDPGSTMRRAVNIVTAIQRVYDFAVTRTSDSIPRLDVYFAPGSSQPTQYLPKAGTTPASLTIAGSSSTNPDEWDDDVIAATYGLHVFTSITGAGPQQYTLGYAPATSVENAFAAGFGYYLQAAATGDSKMIDGLGASSANVIDIETDEPATARGPNVAGWVAMALYDLIDAANESHDPIDGTARNPGAPLSAMDTLDSTTLGAPALYDAFVAQGGNGPGTARILIHHGLLPDDRFEANDSAAEAKSVGTTPLIQRDLVLNIANEDWYRLTVPAAVSALNIDVAFDPLVYDTKVVLQVLAPNGSLVGDGTPAHPGDPVRVVTGPLSAGDYVVRVAHAGGSVLQSYALQAYESLAIVSGQLAPWTVDRPYVHNFAVRGGIPPYTLSPSQALSLPPGLQLNDAFARLSGGPTQVGKFGFTLLVRDRADPANLVSQLCEIVVNPHLEIAIHQFTPLALDRSDGFVFARTGGTDPLTISAASANSLPGGVSMSTVDGRLTGVPTATGSANMQIDATDAAGDAIVGHTTVVVCAPYAGPNAPATLAAGGASCGWFFDALRGTTLSASVKTAKKAPKRVLNAFLVDAKGNAVAGGTVKDGLSGKAGLTGFVVPESGRYFVVLSSDAGPATELTGTLKIGVPSKQSEAVDSMDAGEVLAVRFGAMAGATFTAKGSADKASGLLVGVQALIAPDGRLIDRSQLQIAEKGSVITVSGACDTAGTWTLRFIAKPGPSGSFKYAMKISQPKTATFTID